MGKIIKLGLIGFGYWGPNLARVAEEAENCELVYIADKSRYALNRVRKKHFRIKTLIEYKKILNDKQIDAVLIVTPTETHYQIAKDAIIAGKHVFLEKPLTKNRNQAKKLVELAKAKKITFMVGHVFLYNPAVRKIKELINKGDIGKIRHMHFQRRSLGPIRKDVDVLWDLSPHDISMALYFIDEKPLSVIGHGKSFLRKGINDVISAYIEFKNSIILNFIWSWIDPIKIRDVTIVGDKKMIFFNDVSQFEKVKVYNKNADIIKSTKDVTFGEYQIALRAGGVYIPAIENKEPLKEEFNHFIESIRKNTKPMTDGANGLQVVEIISAIEKSLGNNSRKVRL